MGERSCFRVGGQNPTSNAGNSARPATSHSFPPKAENYRRPAFEHLFRPRHSSRQHRRCKTVHRSRPDRVVVEGLAVVVAEEAEVEAAAQGLL